MSGREHRKDIGVPPRPINEIVKGRRALTADTAVRLARYFSHGPRKSDSIFRLTTTEKSISARKPLHELRKELGALLASQDVIFAAQRVLRHAQISTTASYYTDKKRRITAGLGALLTATDAAIPFPAPTAVKRAPGKPAPGLRTKRTAAQ